jgi:hypothetical protein
MSYVWRCGFGKLDDAVQELALPIGHSLDHLEPIVGSGAVNGHRAHRKQHVPHLKQFLEEGFRIFQVATEHDLLFKSPGLLGVASHQIELALDLRGDNQMGQLERGFHPEVLLFDPVKHGIGIQKSYLGFNRRIERPVHGDKEVSANELVELHVMHMSSHPQVGGWSTVNTWSS